ncbi:MAG: AraC family transcriptional regulator [Paenibacillus sp.]|nr:AraC family transcriptional regulator [Paenibacillus sp.]
MKDNPVEFVDLWFYNLEALSEWTELRPVRIGQNIAKPNYSNGPRQTPYCNMHFIREGKVELSYGGQQVTLSQGDMFCKFPNTVYTYRIVPSNKPLRMAWITFDGAQALHILKMTGFSEHKPYRLGGVDPDVEIVLQQIFQWCMGNSRKQLMMMYSLMYRIFSKLLTEGEEERKHPRNDWVRQSLDFIHAHYTEKITVEDVAKYVCVHRTHLSKIFTKEIGIPPSTYIIVKRLERGRQLLLESALTVTEIALSVGYPDVYSFTRAFTRKYNVSPKTFASHAGGEPNNTSTNINNLKQ